MSPAMSRLLVLINVGLVVAIVAVWALGSSRWQAPEPVAPDRALFALPDATVTAADAYSRDTLLDRPVFLASRRPFPPEPVAAAGGAPKAAAAPDALDSARLTGLLDDGAGAVAILNVDGKSRRLRQGDMLDGWTLQSVERQSAVFADRDGRTRRLSLPTVGGLLDGGGAGAADPAPVQAAGVESPPRARQTNPSKAAAGEPRASSRAERPARVERPGRMERPGMPGGDERPGRRQPRTSPPGDGGGAGVGG